MNIYTVIDGVLKLVELLVNLAIMGIPVWTIMVLDRYRKEWRGWKYYLLALSLVVAWIALVFALARGNSFAKWLTVLTNLAVMGIAIVVVVLVDYCRKDWPTWFYYGLAFAIAEVVYLLPALALIYWSGFEKPIKTTHP